jgi:hypothetical protein
MMGWRNSSFQYEFNRGKGDYYIMKMVRQARSLTDVVEPINLDPKTQDI